jgi:hypothetical protein
MMRNSRWADWFRALVELDRTPEEILSIRLDQIEQHLRDQHSSKRNKP